MIEKMKPGIPAFTPAALIALNPNPEVEKGSP
jgi:hypothetical protein